MQDVAKRVNVLRDQRDSARYASRELAGIRDRRREAQKAHQGERTPRMDARCSWGSEYRNQRESPRGHMQPRTAREAYRTHDEPLDYSTVVREYANRRAGSRPPFPPEEQIMAPKSKGVASGGATTR